MIPYTLLPRLHSGGKRNKANMITVSPLSILKNPLVLLGLLGAGLMFGMPYLMENMDPEVKEAFEARQANGGGVSGQVNGLLSGNGGFDAAGWLAGTNKKEEGTEGVRR